MTERNVRPFFILNPVAGGGRARRSEPIIREALRSSGIKDPGFALTESPGHATVLAREAGDNGFSPVVGIGGDGTMNEIANGLLQASTRAPLAAIPVGTGNDFVRSLGLPRDVEKATRLACSGAPAESIDVGRCGNRYFLNVGSLGFDAQVAQAVQRAPRWLRFGPLPFVVCTLGELVRNTIHSLGRCQLEVWS